MDADAAFRAHRDPLFHYLARFCGDADLAEDALQDTFVRLLERPPRRQDNLRAWLFTVGANLLRDRARSASRRRELLAAQATVRPAATAPADGAETRELRESVRLALAALSERERTAVLMREAGFTHREIAAAIGSTTGTIGTLLARAFDKLGQRLSLEDAP